MHAGPAGLRFSLKSGISAGSASVRSPSQTKTSPCSFAHREAAGAEIAADQRVARHMGAGAVGSETDAVIAALDVVPDHFAGRERRLAVRAAVGERGDLSAVAAEQRQRLVADRSRQRLLAELGRGRGRVPLIAKERAHVLLSSGRQVATIIAARRRRAEVTALAVLALHRHHAAVSRSRARAGLA